MTSMRGKWTSFFFWFKIVLASALLIFLIAAGILLAREMRTSDYQARFFADLASKANYTLGAGPSPAIRFPQSAPYDDRLGYSQLPVFLGKLKLRDFEIAKQARISSGMADIVDQGYFAPYLEKTQSGLRILDCHNDSLFQERYPKRVFERFDDIAPILVQSLLFIENREMLDPRYPKRNPAVEWDRLANAVLIKARSAITGDGRSPGGSTLATQIEKYRHSSEGRTSSIQEKLQQMVSAALRAYQQGEDTSAVRRQIVLGYMNTMPLSAKAGFGEVHGLGDGLWAWYGRDFNEVNRILKSAVAQNGDFNAQAQLYKQALSLLISQRRPSYYFDASESELEQLTDSHLRLLGSAGVITPALRDAALQAKLNRRADKVPAAAVSFVTQKAANAVRTHLAGLLGGSRLYDLDRLDLSVASTLDAPVQMAVTSLLRELREPANAEAAGLNSKQLLARGDPAKVVYSFTLYERGADTNYLRVQTDNFDQPLNINEGTKLDLGSTAKLRTLVTYLDIMDKLHQRLSALDDKQLRELEIDRKDVLTRWAADYLMAAQDKSLGAMLDAALERRYSANNAEGFFTGGGLHHFDNFKREDNSKVMSVRDGLRNSVNLVFIRLMRDIVHHYMFLTPGSSAKLLQDADDPRRAEYLARFADREGQVFMRRFLVKYQGKTAQQAQELLLDNVRPTASRLAAIYRTIAPDAPLDQFIDFVKENLPDGIDPSEPKLAKLYEQYAPQQMSLADRGYVASVHPLELWLVGYLRDHPGASQTKVMQASVAERQAVYSWLFSTHRKHAQDTRILGLLEGEGFLEIHRQWMHMGYPFNSLVPSYATSLGASADRPAALAEMMGILVNDGVRKPNTRIRSLHFAAATPYETLLQNKSGKAERVLSPEVAQAVRGAIRLVVEDGTAKRVKQAFVRPDGSIIPVGGKTGTGDQRFDTYGAGGRLIESRVVNRSATFVFNIDERFFGTIIAYVPGAQAAGYDFTSGLPVQLLKVLAPKLSPLINGAAGGASEVTAPGSCVN
ncbi:MAG: glycosyl transferase family 51 [Candidatus Handelsmanbacteria bacterium RIFCSPLOWO2_12_FULL_64_10]|uniref:peptidoglycan glycosyltransferase n=1 Tax=Handelsmanbacteria sp. (strain RIFCSPLOWO2_12_FULL_64_10) TaxID=1817868 RepID=A0A1F6D2E7_HANXR|nr:MAG: glycosyl transferase family 51 [Candidatus Handelsmanbacteria bacterium RIFCSPLOWO2_12_FULL_64_10]